VPLGNPDRRAAQKEKGLRDVGGGNRNWRLINLDGRAHQPDDVISTYYGDSVGKWDGDTFVVITLALKTSAGSTSEATATARTCGAGSGALHASRLRPHQGPALSAIKPTGEIQIVLEIVRGR